MARLKNPRQRPEVVLCHDHLGGQFGEALFDRLVELEWLTAPPEVTLTDAGRQGLAALGVDADALDRARREPVARCAERRGGRVTFHVGARLGTLLRERAEALGWVRKEGGAWAVTGAGWKGLGALGRAAGERPQPSRPAR